METGRQECLLANPANEVPDRSRRFITLMQKPFKIQYCNKAVYNIYSIQQHILKSSINRMQKSLTVDKCMLIYL